MAPLPATVARLLNPGAKKSGLVINGRPVAVTLRRNSRAKRIIVRLSKNGEGIIVTVPPGASDKKAIEFAASQAAWIEQQLARQPRVRHIEDGAVIMFRGVEHVICHSNERRTPVWTGTSDERPVIFVSGQKAHLPRRLGDWLKRQARSDLSAAATDYAQKMGVKVWRLSIRDTSSRWGSCSAQGALSFSWRLVLAPPEVLDYVAAHEVAHLIEMNHSERFWQLVETHCPHAGRAKSWLRRNGSALHAIGI